MHNNLHGLKILITRQDKFATNLYSAIKFYNGKPEILPLFTIESTLNQASIQNLNKKLTSCETAIFVSRNAAEIVMPYIDKTPQKIWAAVGAGTAKFLQRSGLRNIIYPQSLPYDSESLLKKLPLTKTIVFTGEGGRKWPAYMDLIPVYKRLPVKLEHIPKVDIIVISCITSLMGLPVFDIPLLVVSDRIYKKALEMGFSRVYTTDGMSDTAILGALLNWRNIN